MKDKNNLGNSYLAGRQLLSRLNQTKPSSSQDNLNPVVCPLLLLTAICIFCAKSCSWSGDGKKVLEQSVG